MVIKTDKWYMPLKITYNEMYTKHVYEPALFAACFGYTETLHEKLIECTLQQDLPLLQELMNQWPLYIEMREGCLTIKNYITWPEDVIKYKNLKRRN